MLIANTVTKTLIFGTDLAERIQQLAAPTDLIVADRTCVGFQYSRHLPTVAIVDATDLADKSLTALHQCLQQKASGFPVSVMGVLAWDTLRSERHLQLDAEQLASFDDLLLLPAKAFEFDLRFAKLAQTAKARCMTQTPKYVVGPLSFDVHNMSVEILGRFLRLTRRETELLLFVARHPDEVISKERIAHEVWHVEHPQPSFENVLNGHVSRLREKLGDAGCWGLLRTVRKVGIEFSPASASFQSESQMKSARLRPTQERSGASL